LRFKPNVAIAQKYNIDLTKIDYIPTPRVTERGGTKGTSYRT